MMGSSCSLPRRRIFGNNHNSNGGSNAAAATDGARRRCRRRGCRGVTVRGRVRCYGGRSGGSGSGRGSSGNRGCARGGRGGGGLCGRSQDESSSSDDADGENCDDTSHSSSEDGGRCRAVRHSVYAEVPDRSISHFYPPLDNYEPHPTDPTLRNPKSLADLCVDAVCRSLPDLDGELPAGLPRDVTDAIVASLTNHGALNATTLRALRRCELGTLTLSGCRGVSDSWLASLSGGCATNATAASGGAARMRRGRDDDRRWTTRTVASPPQLMALSAASYGGSHSFDGDCRAGDTAMSDGCGDEGGYRYHCCEEHDDDDEEAEYDDDGDGISCSAESFASCSTSSFVSASSTPYRSPIVDVAGDEDGDRSTAAAKMKADATNAIPALPLAPEDFFSTPPSGSAITTSAAATATAVKFPSSPASSASPCAKKLRPSQKLQPRSLLPQSSLSLPPPPLVSTEPPHGHASPKMSSEEPFLFREDSPLFSAGDHNEKYGDPPPLSLLHAGGQTPQKKKKMQKDEGKYPWCATNSSAPSSSLSSTLTHLDLRGSQRLTDRGLLQLTHTTALSALEYVRLDDCHGISGRGLVAFARSTKLTALSCANCRRLGDDAVVHVGHLVGLETLNLGGCRCLTDRSLESVGGFVNLRRLDLSQCDLLTDAGLTNLHSLTSLEELSLGWCRRITDEGLCTLVEQPQRRSTLLVLRLARCSVTDEGLKHVGRLGELRELDLNGCTNVGSAALGAALEGLTNLTSLDVSYCPGILRSPWQGKINALKSLELCYSGVRDSHLARLKHLPALEELNLDSCPVGDWALAHLADNNVAPNLSSLDLADSEISDAGMAKLCKFENMTRLSLFYCNVTNAGLRHLASMTKLEVLNLDSREIGDEGLRWLRRLPLRALDVFSGRVSDLGCQHLSKIKTLTSLELCGGGIGDNGCAHLATLSELTSLNLSQNERITNRGAASLAALSNLKALNLSNTHVNSSALKFLSGLVKLRSLAMYGCVDVEEDGPGMDSLRSELPVLRCLRLNTASDEDGVIEHEGSEDDSDVADDDGGEWEEEAEEAEDLQMRYRQMMMQRQLHDDDDHHTESDESAVSFMSTGSQEHASDVDEFEGMDDDDDEEHVGDEQAEVDMDDDTIE